MIQPRNTSCTTCTSIPKLLDKIDCKIFETAKAYYNNITLMLNYPINQCLMLDLLNYKRILTYRMYNEEYASTFELDDIKSKVALLTKNCKSKCQQTVSAPTTTTTTTTI